MNKLLFIVGLTILAVASARVARDDELSFENFLNNIQTGINTMQQNFLKAAGASDADEFKQKAEEYFGTVAKKWDTWAEEAQEKTKDFENVPVVKEVQQSIQKVVDEFKSDHPAVAEDVEKYLGKLKENTEDVMHKIKDMGDSEEGKKIKELSESLLASAQKQLAEMTVEMKEQFHTTSA